MNFLVKRPNRDFFDTSLQRLFDNFYDDFFNDFNPLEQLGKASYPKCNVINNNNEIVVEAAVPGLSKDDIDIEIKDRILTIRSNGTKEKKEDNNGYMMREIRFSSFSRSFEITDSNIDLDKVDAKFKNGVLKLTIPKLEMEKSTLRKIDIK